MKKHLYNSLLAFFGGLCGASTLFIISCLIFDIAHLESPFLWLPYGKFWDILLVAGPLEEGVKFLLIKQDIEKHPHGFVLGLGFGVSEATLKYVPKESGITFQARAFAVSLHILTAGIICYFIKKNKPVLGLVIAILIHTGYDLISNWTVH